MPHQSNQCGADKAMSCCTHNITSALAVMAAADHARHLRNLADLLARTTFRGQTTNGELYYSDDTDPHGRRVHLTRTGLRALASPGTPNYVLDRLRLALIGHGAKLQIELDDLAINAPRGLTPGADLQHALDALVNRRTLERIRELEEDADDADLHLATLQHHLGTGIDATIPRHPAGSAR